MAREPGRAAALFRCCQRRILDLGHLLQDEQLAVLEGTEAFLVALGLQLELLEDLDVRVALLGERSHVALLVIGQGLALGLELFLRGGQLVGEKLRGAHGLLLALLEVLLDEERGELVGHEGHDAGVLAGVADVEVTGRFGRCAWGAPP